MSAPQELEPSRDAIELTKGPILLEFGASWCPHCRAVAATIAACLDGAPEVQHIKIEDGPGKPLGRSFGVKLWPTLVFLRDGRVVTTLVRPDKGEIQNGFDSIMRPA